MWTKKRCSWEFEETPHPSPFSTVFFKPCQWWRHKLGEQKNQITFEVVKENLMMTTYAMFQALCGKLKKVRGNSSEEIINLDKNHNINNSENIYSKFCLTPRRHASTQSIHTQTHTRTTHIHTHTYTQHSQACTHKTHTIHHTQTHISLVCHPHKKINCLCKTKVH